MPFILFSVSSLLMLMTFVQSAPTASLDTATLLKNAQEAQKLNAQFQSANSAATGSCTNGDTTCIKDAIASCVNGQFVTSNACPATQQCFALPSVKSNGTIIACTSEKSAQSLINASGATGDVTGSGSGASASSINPPAASPTSSGSNSAAASAAAETAMSMDADCITTPTSTPTTGPSESVVTVTVTLIPSIPTTLPSVTQTLSPEQASSVLASLLAQGGPAATAEPDCENAPSEAPISASATDIPPATVIPSAAAASKILSSASYATTAAAITNGADADSPASSVSGYGAGGYNGY